MKKQLYALSKLVLIVAVGGMLWNAVGNTLELDRPGLSWWLGHRVTWTGPSTSLETQIPSF